VLSQLTNRRQKSKSQTANTGFTIIEVMIVLAIAGLILLIVFLAVPALQRSSRNTARKSDASRIATAVSNFVSNNNGALPGTGTDGDTIVSDAGTLGEYKFTEPSVYNTAERAGTFNVESSPAEFDTNYDKSFVDSEVYLVEGAMCPTTGYMPATATASRGAVIEYPVEQNGGTYTLVCLTAL
jgi:prepilin-type N-terminal cleavage/methylation domain-containing protein